MRIGFIYCILCLALYAPAAGQTKKTDREYDGFMGAVRTVKVETAKLEEKSSKAEEKSRALSQSSVYDANGNLIERQDRDHQSSGLDRHAFSYDASGKRTEKHYLSGMPGPALSPSGNVLSTDGSIAATWKFEYDKDGNRVGEAAYWRSGELWFKDDYTFDSSGRRIEKRHHSMEGLRYRQVYTYGSDGRMTEMVEYKPDGSVSKRESYSYTDFDSAGNWVRRITSMWNGKKSAFEPKQVTYRTMTY